jgi:hypothetical protein
MKKKNKKTKKKRGGNYWLKFSKQQWFITLILSSRSASSEKKTPDPPHGSRENEEKTKINRRKIRFSQVQKNKKPKFNAFRIPAVFCSWKPYRHLAKK